MWETLSFGMLYRLKHSDYVQVLFNLSLHQTSGSSNIHIHGLDVWDGLEITAPVVRTWTYSQMKSVQPPVTALFTLDLCWFAFKMCSLVICSHPTDVFFEPFYVCVCVFVCVCVCVCVCMCVRVSPSLIVSICRLTGGYAECDQVHWAAQSSAR